jgi:hypothetical protein
LPKLVRRAWGSLDAGPHHVALEAGRQMLLLLERVLTWLGGCAWASVLLAPSASPSLALAVKDLAAASGLLILVVGALVLLGGRTERVVVGARTASSRSFSRIMVAVSGYLPPTPTPSTKRHAPMTL